MYKGILKKGLSLTVVIIFATSTLVQAAPVDAEALRGISLRNTPEVLVKDISNDLLSGIKSHPSGGEKNDDYTVSREIKHDNAEVLKYAERGVNYFNQGLYAEAIGEFKEVLKTDPNFAVIQSMLGEAYLKMGKYQSARRAFELALRLNPKDIISLCNLGFVLAEQGQLDLAIDKFKEATRINPKATYAIENLMRTLRDKELEETTLSPAMFSMQCGFIMDYILERARKHGFEEYELRLTNSDSFNMTLEISPVIRKLQDGKLEVVSKKLIIYTRFVQQIGLVYMVWPELTNQILEAYFTQAEMSVESLKAAISTGVIKSSDPYAKEAIDAGIRDNADYELFVVKGIKSFASFIWFARLFLNVFYHTEFKAEDWIETEVRKFLSPRFDKKPPIGPKVDISRVTDEVLEVESQFIEKAKENEYYQLYFKDHGTTSGTKSSSAGGGSVPKAMRDELLAQLRTARSGDFLRITELEKVFETIARDTENTHKVTAVFERANGAVDIFKTRLPNWDILNDEQRDLAAFYLLTFVYNRLGTYGAEKVHISCEPKYYDYIEQAFTRRDEHHKGNFAFGDKNEYRAPYYHIIPYINNIYRVAYDDYERTITFDLLEAKKISNYHPAPPSMQKHLANGHPRKGTALGIDVGLTDAKYVVLQEGEMIFCKSYKWGVDGGFDPEVVTSGKFHIDAITKWAKEVIRDADVSGKIQFLGLSWNAAVTNNKIVGNAPVTEGLSPEEFAKTMAELPEHISQALEGKDKTPVPVVILNDGDATAVWAAIDMEKPDTLCFSLGSGLAAGYVNENGELLDILGEMGNVIIDISQSATGHSYSKVGGVLQQYLSQRAVFRLALKKGITRREDFSDIPYVIEERIKAARAFVSKPKVNISGITGWQLLDFVRTALKDPPDQKEFNDIIDSTDDKTEILAKVKAFCKSPIYDVSNVSGDKDFLNYIESYLRDSQRAETLKQFKKAMAVNDAKLSYVQSLIGKDKRADEIFKEIGEYLAVAIAETKNFLPVKNVVIVGRVTGGEAGSIILNTARDILRRDYPQLSRIEIYMPTADTSFVQAIGAAYYAAQSFNPPAQTAVITPVKSSSAGEVRQKVIDAAQKVKSKIVRRYSSRNHREVTVTDKIPYSKIALIILRIARSEEDIAPLIEEFVRHITVISRKREVGYAVCANAGEHSGGIVTYHTEEEWQRMHLAVDFERSCYVDSGGRTHPDTVLISGIAWVRRNIKFTNSITIGLSKPIENIVSAIKSSSAGEEKVEELINRLSWDAQISETCRGVGGVMQMTENYVFVELLDMLYLDNPQERDLASKAIKVKFPFVSLNDERIKARLIDILINDEESCFTALDLLRKHSVSDQEIFGEIRDRLIGRYHKHIDKDKGTTWYTYASSIRFSVINIFVKLGIFDHKVISFLQEVASTDFDEDLRVGTEKILQSHKPAREGDSSGTKSFPAGDKDIEKITAVSNLPVDETYSCHFSGGEQYDMEDNVENRPSIAKELFTRNQILQIARLLRDDEKPVKMNITISETAVEDTPADFVVDSVSLTIELVLVSPKGKEKVIIEHSGMGMYDSFALDRFKSLSFTRAGAKSSSAGGWSRLLAIYNQLESARGKLTYKEAFPKLNTNLLATVIDEYQKVIEELNTLKAKSAEEVIAITEPLKRAEASLGVIALSKDIVAEEAKMKDVTGTIIVNDNEVPANQRILLTMLDKDEPYLKTLEERLGCKVRLLSQFNSTKDRAANMIAISKQRIDTIPNLRYINIDTVIEDAYIPLEQIIVFAKGLLAYNRDTRQDLDSILAQMYRLLAKRPIQPQLLDKFLNESIFVLALPAPVPVDEKFYDDLHKQAMAALIAA